MKWEFFNSSNIIIAVLIIHLLSGCSPNQNSSSKQSEQRQGNGLASCGPQTLAVYSKLRKNEYETEQIYQIIGKSNSDAVSMLELKQAARQLGFEVEGYLLDPDNLEEIETYAIIPIRENKSGSYSDPLHFVLVRFFKGKTYEIDYNTMEEKPLKLTWLKKVWKGPALFLR